MTGFANYVQPAHYNRSDGARTCGHNIPVGPGACAECHSLTDEHWAAGCTCTAPTMPDQTPAQTLRAAAAMVREAATAAEADAPSPWQSQPRHDSDPTSTVSLWDAHSPLLHGAAGTRGRAPFVTGPVGRHIALLHPGVGAALADWLDALAAEHPHEVFPERPSCGPACEGHEAFVMCQRCSRGFGLCSAIQPGLAVARALLGGPS